MKLLEFDYVVVGSGLAGLMSALHLADHGRVLILTKTASSSSNTQFAQGGIACVMTPEDSFEQHVADTVGAGAGLCDEAVVRAVVAAGPAGIRELERHGARFARRDGDPGGGYDLGTEGGHTRRRVLHAGDVTGRHISETLLDEVRRRPTVTVLEHHMVIDVVTTSWLGLPGDNRCIGAYVLNRVSGEILAVRAPYTVLATGGGGKVYLYTSNPDVATGDGVAIAWRAGLPIENMEFIQFHPTCLYHPEAKSFLISEAVRGEGGIIVNEAGEPFVDAVDPRGSLAPRDIVARAIDREMKATGASSVFLDIRHQSRDFLKGRFPTIYDTCLKFGVDMATDRIPVVPAAHYFCGGVAAGIDGSTAVTGLYVCGEAACTGLHGANRLASNSLLEALVCGTRTAEAIAARGTDSRVAELAIPDWTYGDAVPSDELVVVEHNWNEVRHCMWDYVGIVRSDKRLERALRRIRNLRAEIHQYYLEYLVTPDTLELRNIADVAELIVRCALQRRESRGLHYTLDYLETSPSYVRNSRIDDGPGSHVPPTAD